ncbi:unnamed protein product [Discula destructiva]
MDEAVEDLVLAPFRDIVAQGTAALSNAETGGKNDEGMRAAAHGLLREGERALRRIEPLCRRKCEDFGATFVDALKDDAEISRLVEQLNDLLYDFEEFVEAASFDSEKVGELQALSRKAAPVISHRITRMKLAVTQGADDDRETTSSPASCGPMVLIRQPSNEIGPQHGETLPYPDDDEADRHGYAMPRLPSQEYDARQADMPPASLLPTVLEEEHPPSSSALLDPWSQRSLDIEQGLELIGRRGETKTYSDSAIGSEANSEHAYSPTLFDQQHQQTKPSPQPPVPPKSPARLVTPNASLGSSSGHHGRDNISPALSRQQQRDSIASLSVNVSVRSAGSDPPRRNSYFDGVSPMTPTHGSAGESLLEFQTKEQVHSPHVRPLFDQFGGGSPASLAGRMSEAMEPMSLPSPGLITDGLIPVEADQVHQPVSPVVDMQAQLSDCALNLSSSYYRFKGFCAGAMEIVQGGLGIKHIKKQGISVANIEIAKCKACSYELEWKAVERDLNNDASENLKSEGIGFRLRVLSKSHLPAKRVGEQNYGCLFCVQQRQTTHPNDATVFFSQRQLFAHLARHPRPLPRVPGVTVIQSEQMPAQFANNYDLDFAASPRVSPLAHMMCDLSQLPTAIAVQTCRPGAAGTLRRRANDTEVLSYAAGARILGVKFPDKYQGEWCAGWSDHEYGLIEAEALSFEPPAANSVRNQGSSSMKAVARWKSAATAKDSKGDWLVFGKGEVITNIGWSHQDHWCWRGTNAKGKSGLFLRPHIEPGTLMEDASRSGGVSVTSAERKAGLLSRISVRHRSSSSTAGNGSGGGGGGGGVRFGRSSSRASLN